MSDDFAYGHGMMAGGDMAKAERPKEIFSTHDAARICRVTPMTVIRWIKEGKIPAFKTAGGHRRILYDDLARFCVSRGIPFLQAEPSQAGRILVAENDPAVRGLIGDTIRVVDNRFAVELAPDAFTAGRMLAEFRPALLFLDQQLPGVDALEVCARLSHDAETPIAVVVLASHANDAERAFKSRGALGCIVPPCTAVAVERMVRLAFHLPESSGAPAIHILDKDGRGSRTLRRELETRAPGSRVTVFDSPLDLAFALGSETPDAVIVESALERSVLELVRKVVARGADAPVIVVRGGAAAIPVDDVLEALDERRRGVRAASRRDPRRGV